MSGTYKHKYIKYKKKYIQLKKLLDIPYDFYFIHSTMCYNNLLDILKTGILYPGKFVKPEQRQYCGEETESDYIFMNIYFEDISNIEFTYDYTLIFHPKIMMENGFIFNRGWAGKNENSIEIFSNDNNNITNKKIKSIHDFLKDPELPAIIKEKSPGTHHHEILFDHPINLDNGNLIGIICNYCDESIFDWKTGRLDKSNDRQFLKLIKKAIKNKSYSDVKIYTRNAPLPTLEKLFNN